jgi:hypothetical protein
MKQRTIPLYGRVLAGKTMNASVEERPTYRIVSVQKPESCEPRFGSRMASCLLILELGSVKRLHEFDVEWFEGELLRRLRGRVVAKPGVTAGEIGGYDSCAGKYDYGGTDVGCSLLFGKVHYQNILAEILTELYAEEGASGQITSVTLETLGVTWPVRLVKPTRPKRRAKRRRRSSDEEET